MIANAVLLLSMAGLLLIGTPIGVALGLAGVLAILVGLDSYALGMVGTTTYSAIASYPLIAIPLFVLTGMVFERTGIGERLVTFARAIVGPRRGGLALVAVLVCVIMSGMSGSGPADAAMVATVMLPSMTRAGYPPSFSASVIAASGSIAILIPPSIALIVYSLLVPGIDLRALFAAGVFPGLLAGVAIAVPTLIISRIKDFGVAEEQGRPPFWPSLWRAMPALLAPIIILGGLRSGLFTPTEVAVVAVCYGLLVGAVVTRNLNPRMLYELFADAAQISAVIMVIISLAALFAWAGSTLGAFDATSAWILGITDDPTLILLFIMVVLLFAGMIIDGISIYLITLPLLIPIANHFGWNLTWFGILMAMNIAIGQFTPPVAVNLIVTSKIANVPIESTVKWIVWLVLSMLVALLLVIRFPGIALWLPEVLGFRI